MAEKGSRGTKEVQKTKRIRGKGEGRQRRKRGVYVAVFNGIIYYLLPYCSDRSEKNGKPWKRKSGKIQKRKRSERKRKRFALWIGILTIIVVSICLV